MTPRRRLGLMAATSWAMTFSTLQQFAIVMLTATLIGELGLARWQIGVLGATNTGVGALASPRLGRLADRLGCRRSMIALGVASAAGLFFTAAAVNFWLLLAASGVAGLAQGASGPITNKVIAEGVPRQQQGLISGVNQSGVQVAVVLSGLIIPAAIATIGWRWAMTLLGLVTLLGAAATRARFPADAARIGGDGGGSDASDEPLARFVYRVAVYAFLLGLTAGGVNRFYPLFVQEILGFSQAGAGLAVSVAGMAAIVGRLAWARLVTTRLTPGPALLVLGAGSSVAVGLLVVTELFGSWILWPTVVVIAFTVSAWNVVAMLAVLRSVPTQLSGRATGVVLMGFFGGLTVAAPVVGVVIDRSGSYQTTWAGLAAISLAGAMTVARPRIGRESTVPAPVATRPVVVPVTDRAAAGPPRPAAAVAASGRRAAGWPPVIDLDWPAPPVIDLDWPVPAVIDLDRPAPWMAPVLAAAVPSRDRGRGPGRQGRTDRAAGTMLPACSQRPVAKLRQPSEAPPNLRPVARIVWSSFFCDEAAQVRAHDHHVVGDDGLHVPAVRHRGPRRLAHR